MKELAGSGFEIKNLSVVGKGYYTDEKVVIGEDGDDCVSCFHVILFQGQAALGKASGAIWVGHEPARDSRNWFQTKSA